MSEEVTTFDWDGPCTIGDAEWLRRRDLMLADTSDGFMWLSFVDGGVEDPDRPGHALFLGVCIVPGGNIVLAARTARQLGCNPGGEVAGWPMNLTPHPSWVGVLMGREAGDIEPNTFLTERVTA